MNWDNFKQKGYRVLKIPKSQHCHLHKIKKDFEAYVDQIYYSLRQNYTKKMSIEKKTKFILKSEYRKNIYDISQKLRSLYSFTDSKISKKILSELNFKIPVLRNHTLRVDVPNDSFLQPPHQDINNMISVKSFTAWIPLLFKKQTCSLNVYINSHKIGQIKHNLKIKNKNFKTLRGKYLKEFKKEKLNLNFGEILLFHPFLIHESVKSNNFRLTYLYRFDDVSQADWLGKIKNPFPVI